MASPVKAALASVFVVDDDEIYACGPGSKHVLEGSVHGWTRRGPFDRTLYRIAKHEGTVYVACGRSGLYTLAAGATELEVLRDDYAVSHLDVRGGLMVSADNHFGEKEPGAGVRFMTGRLSSYIELAGRSAPSW